MQNYHYMRATNEDGEPTGPVLEIPLNEWQGYRQTGHVFVTRQDWLDQQSGAVAEDTPEDDGGDGNNYPTMANTKDEILAYAEANNIEVNSADTKSDILWGIAQVLEIDPAELGVEE